MSLGTDCKKTKAISAQHSFATAKDQINKNFEAHSACIESIISVINSGGVGGSSEITFPQNPNPNIEYNLLYSNGTYILVQDTSGDENNRYWLLNNEDLLIKERTQHLVKTQFIMEAGSSVTVEPTGQLVVL